MKTPQISEHISALRNKAIYSAVYGNWKSFKNATINQAKLSVKFPKDHNASKQPSIRVPLFSSGGLNMCKICFLELFRKKTSAEKELEKQGKNDKIFDFLL